jgi:hypothetical protein
MRYATAATNALDHQADIAKVQEWLGHANIATTRIYDHRRTRPEDSPTFKVAYRHGACRPRLSAREGPTSQKSKHPVAENNNPTSTERNA